MSAFYFGAKTAFVLGASPYRHDDLLSRFRKDFPGQIYPFLYPPPSLLLFYPLVWMSYNTANLVTLVVNNACVLVLLWFIPFKLCRLDITRETLLSVVMLLYILSYVPIPETVGHGQVNLVLACLLVVFWKAYRDGRSPSLAGFMLCLATLLKTYPAALLVLLGLRKRYACVAYSFLFLGLACLAGAVLLPAGTWGDWFRLVLPNGRYGKTPTGLFPPGNVWNHSLNGLTSRIFLGSDKVPALLPCGAAGSIVPTVLALLAVAITIVAVVRASRKAPSPAGTDTELSAFLLLTYLVAPISWSHHLVYILPCVCTLLSNVFRGRMRLSAGWVVVAFAAGCAIAWPLWLTCHLKFPAVGALWLVCVRALWTRAEGAEQSCTDSA